jgi:hypothetical protein
MYYIFNKTDSGIQGKAFEMAVKAALNRKNADRVSPCGGSDFRMGAVNYEVKQNGTCIQYHEGDKYIKGSNRVLYATHIAYTIAGETEEQIAIEVDLLNTEIFVLDRQEFVAFLLENGMVKVNASRGTANIQTCYNYKKDAYHGRTGKRIEEWAREHEIDDDIVSLIYDAMEA